MSGLLRLCGLTLAACLCVAGCGLPRDPNSTTEHVRGGRLRVGLVEGAPWVTRTSRGSGTEPGGVEPELVRRLAQQLNATPEWVWGSEQEHMEALEHYQLDLVIGGLTDDTPWNGRVGLSMPYLEDRIAVGTPPEWKTPASLKGRQVATEEGEATAGLLEDKGAVPVRLYNPGRTEMAVAAPTWQLEAWGMRTTKFELDKQKHVFAVPPGENRWLLLVDQFLSKQRPEVLSMLRQQAQQALADGTQQRRLTKGSPGGTP